MKTDAQRIEELETALRVSMGFNKPYLPDGPMASLAAPDWFVACAAVMSDLDDTESAMTLLEKFEDDDFPTEFPEQIECTFTDEDETLSP